MKIAVLLTCFNRCQKTLRALDSLYKAAEVFNEKYSMKLNLEVFLTDDGCTDNTSSNVKKAFPDKNITIVEADGNAFWAGGMRLAWNKALEYHNRIDFYLLINDDAQFLQTAFDEMFKTHNYALATYKKGGVYTGFIADEKDTNKIIYGAKYHKKAFLSKTYNMMPKDMPQECMFTNANFLVVDKHVVDEIGKLSIEYKHRDADWDYGIRALKAGFPVLTTYGVCGVSVNDHDSYKQEAEKVLKMNLKDRKQYLNRPQRGYHDAFFFLKRFDYPKYIVMKIAYFLNLYMPHLFYKLQSIRP